MENIKNNCLKNEDDEIEIDEFDDIYYNSIDSVRNTKKYKNNQNHINHIKNILINDYNISGQLVDSLIFKIRENSIMQFELASHNVMELAREKLDKK